MERWERDGQALESCTILITQANTPIASIHDRMPVILDPPTKPAGSIPPSPTPPPRKRCWSRARPERPRPGRWARR